MQRVLMVVLKIIYKALFLIYTRSSWKFVLISQIYNLTCGVVVKALVERGFFFLLGLFQ